jgi:serine transporter
LALRLLSMHTDALTNNPPTWTPQDTTWSLGLFSTAIGAGILFLPIELGQAGIWGLLLLALFIVPSTYFTHLALARFVLSHPTSKGNIVEVCGAHWGKHAAQAVSWLYVAAIVPNLLVYSIGLTNTIESFIGHQLGGPAPNRLLLSLGLSMAMILVCAQNPKKIIRVCEAMAYPLIGILVLLSLYLIPHWRMDMLLFQPDKSTLLSSMWLSIPVLIFSFNYSSAVSSFSHMIHQAHGHHAPAKARQILQKTSILLIGLVLLFTLSCILTLSPEQLSDAKTQNLSVLSYIANTGDLPLLAFLGPPIACLAIFSSFCGFYLGADEGMQGVVQHLSKSHLSPAQKRRLIQALLFISIWAAAYYNPNILGLMEMVCGPLITLILFALPLFALYRLPTLKQWRNPLLSAYLLSIAALSITAIVHPFI